MIKIAIIIVQTIVIISLVSYLVFDRITPSSGCEIGAICFSDSGQCGKGKKCVDEVLECTNHSV